MLSSIFPQGACIELYNASSNELLKLWKMKGKINKEFEPYSKTYIHTLLNAGTSIMSIPNQERQFLQIQNSFLLFQFILINPKGFFIDLNLRDKNHNKKKLKIQINNYPLNIWTNLLIDVGSLYQQTYHNILKYIDSILITGNITIRKIYSLQNKNEVLPKSLEFGKSINLQNYLLDDFNLPYTKINLKYNDQPNKKDLNKSIMNNVNNSPMKIGRQISPLRMDNKSNIYSMNEKTKKNIEFAKKIPDLTRLKNEINYGLKIKSNGIGSIRNINKIIGYNIIENLETYNDVKTPVKDINRIRDNSSRKNQRSLDKYNYKREINEIKTKNKSINPKYRNKYINSNSKKYLLNDTSNSKNIINKNEITNNDNDIYKDIDNAKNNINKIVFHNDTIYNYGNNKNSNKNKYISYGIPIQSTVNKNENINNNNELILPKIEKNNIQLPIIKSSIQQQNNNNIENNYKYGNFEIMLDSALINNSKVQAQLYDSIEEESCLINNNINSTLIDGSKMDDKIIKIDPEYNKRRIKEDNKNKNEFSITNTELPNISNLINDDTNNSNRPYTPPLSKLVPLNQSRNIGKNINFGDEIVLPKNKINPNNISYAKLTKNSDKLIYDEIKQCYYDPKTNIYYDIKNLL